MILGIQSALGQHTATTEPGHHNEHRKQDTALCSDKTHYTHRLSGSDFFLNIPNEFKANKAGNDDFAFQEKGTVAKFAYLENIPVSTFCDSMTDAYFSKQGLSNMLVATKQGIKIYSGKFDIGKVPYIRAFYIYEYKKSTVVGILNYPEKLQDELEDYFLSMFIAAKDD